MSHSRREAGGSSQDLLNSDGGIVMDSLNLIRSYCIEWSYEVSRSQVFPLRDEVLKLQQRLQAWKDAEQGLDQKLARAPQVRRDVFRILMPCIWELRQGLPLYRLSIQNTLREDTDRIMEQATNLARYVPPKGEHFPHTNIIEFIGTCYPSFKSYVDNLYEMSPTLGCLFENIDSLTTQLGQERSRDLGLASKIYVSLGQRIRGIRPSKQQKNGLLYDAQHPRRDPDSAKFSSNNSSGSAGSSNVSSVFTQTGNNSSGQPMTDTPTSTATSHAQEPHRDTDPLAPFTPQQDIIIRDYSRQTDKRHYGLFDSGSSDCFIVRDAVHELDLQIHQLPNEETYELLEDLKVSVIEYVEPHWRLKQGRKWHKNDKFFVIDALPNGYHMVIGTATYDKMDVGLFARKSALVAFLTGRKGSSKGRSPQEQLGHAQQSRDDVTHWKQTQKTLEQDHAIARRSTSLGKPPHRALHKEESSTAQVKQKPASLCK